MAGMNDVKQRLSDLACTGAAKAKKLTAVAKLKADSMAQRDSIRKAYEELGRLWYGRNGQQPKEPYAGLCARIAKARAAIEANERKIKNIKEEAG